MNLQQVNAKQIRIKEEPTSAFVLDNDMSEGNFDEGLRLVLRCRHDRIEYDLNTQDMWCADCQNEHLSTIERLEYLRAHDELDGEPRKDDE